MDKKPRTNIQLIVNYHHLTFSFIHVISHPYYRGGRETSIFIVYVEVALILDVSILKLMVVGPTKILSPAMIAWAFRLRWYNYSRYHYSMIFIH